jgi:hypothetical protein
MAEPFEFTAPDYDPAAAPEPWEIAEDAKEAWMEGRAPAFNDPDGLDQEEEPHFCESPSCMRFPGCAAYRYDSHAAGYWGPGEEEAERYGWAVLDAEFDRMRREEPRTSPPSA